MNKTKSFYSSAVSLPNSDSVRSFLGLWWVILWFGILPILGLGVWAVHRWQSNLQENRMVKQWLDRQNLVLVYDALGVATGFSDLLEKATRDVVILSLLPVEAKRYLEFYLAQAGNYTRFDTRNHAIQFEPLPFYNKIAFLDETGTQTLAIVDGEIDQRRVKKEECQKKKLCDSDLINSAMHLRVGEMQFGRILRLYAPIQKKESSQKAGIGIIFRIKTGFIFAQIDYLHLRDHLTTPVFPYDSKRDLMQAYQKGNYIYVVDRDKNIVLHPYYAHVMGIHPETGEWMKPIRFDEEMGSAPINLSAYERGKMKQYYTRLLQIFSESSEIEIFEAENFNGTGRILSVAPITFALGKSKPNQLFGYVVVGCSLEYFQGPKERLEPYY